MDPLKPFSRMDLNGSTACYQHCSNGITMCVQNQWAFLKVEILNGFKWSISRRVNPNALSIVTEQYKSNKIQQLPLLSRELGLIVDKVLIKKKKL